MSQKTPKWLEKASETVSQVEIAYEERLRRLTGSLDATEKSHDDDHDGDDGQS